MNPQDRSEFFRGKTILAPLTKGGNLPFRRLVVEFGAPVTTSEMALAHKIRKGHRPEQALLRSHPTESAFGVQLAGRLPDDMADAAKIAVERGARFIDINLGCPIDLFCRRGIGAALMQKPTKVGKLVAALREAVDVPISIKMRLGWDEKKPTFLKVAAAAEAEGVDALTLHGRSRKQRYRRAASWEAVGELVQAVKVPVIGNGDVLSWRDAKRAKELSGCSSLMLARGALIKPWLFAEIRDGRDYLLDAETRLTLLRRYRDLALEHFGADERGRVRVLDFLTWHQGFFARYRPTPSDEWTDEDHPLIQVREQPPTPGLGLAGMVDLGDETSQAELAQALLAEVPVQEDRHFEATGPPASAILEASMETHRRP